MSILGFVAAALFGLASLAHRVILRRERRAHRRQVARLQLANAIARRAADRAGTITAESLAREQQLCASTQRVVDALAESTNQVLFLRTAVNINARAALEWQQRAEVAEFAVEAQTHAPRCTCARPQA